MPNKRTLTVFLCSTYSDLAIERSSVLEGVRKLQLQHDSMEFFGARSSQPIETCLEEVRKSDILVVIVGHKYGSLVPNQTISFSEAEYSEGIRLGKPCLVYFRDDNVPVLPKDVERDPQKLAALQRFKDLLGERHTIALFRNSSDLAVSVVADLSRTVQSLEETRSNPERPEVLTESVMDQVVMVVREALEKQISERALLSSINLAIATLLVNEGKRAPLVFISYSHADKEMVKAVASGLKAQGVDIWYDEESINTGQSISNEVSSALDSADFLAFFISKNSVNSNWVRLELNAIISRMVGGQRSPLILPILLDDSDIPPLLRDRKYLDLRDGDVHRGVQELVRSIKGRLERRR